LLERLTLAVLTEKKKKWFIFKLNQVH
jgi:hypothetical protein